MKTCGKCKIRKKDSEFYERGDDQSGLRSKCISCFIIDNDKRKKQYCKTIVGYLRRTYSNIRHRCDSPKNKAYKYYGGRGIKCKFTRDEFVDHVINDLQVDPRNLDVDRINNDSHYEPGNIRFITHKKNMQNKRQTRKLSDKNVRIIIYMWRTGLFLQKEIAKIYDVSASIINEIVNGKTYKHIWRKRKCVS